MNIPIGKYLGTLCKRGHEWEDSGKSLRLKSGECVSCNKIVVRKYIKSKKHQDTRKKYELGNIEKLRKIHAEYYSKNSEVIKKRSAIWAKSNPERRTRIYKVHYQRNKDDLKISSAKYYQENKKSLNTMHEIWKKENRETYLKCASRSAKKSAKNLTDGYIRQKIKAKNNIQTADIPQELVDLQRAKIRLFRLIKEKRNGEKNECCKSGNNAGVDKSINESV